jgi:hypothetical protein
VRKIIKTRIWTGTIIADKMEHIQIYVLYSGKPEKLSSCEKERHLQDGLILLNDAVSVSEF